MVTWRRETVGEAGRDCTRTYRQRETKTERDREIGRKGIQEPKEANEWINHYQERERSGELCSNQVTELAKYIPWAT